MIQPVALHDGGPWHHAVGPGFREVGGNKLSPDLPVSLREITAPPCQGRSLATAFHGCPTRSGGMLHALQAAWVCLQALPPSTHFLLGRCGAHPERSRQAGEVPEGQRWFLQAWKTCCLPQDPDRRCSTWKPPQWSSICLGSGRLRVRGVSFHWGHVGLLKRPWWESKDRQVHLTPRGIVLPEARQICMTPNGDGSIQPSSSGGKQHALQIWKVCLQLPRLSPNLPTSFGDSPSTFGECAAHPQTWVGGCETWWLDLCLAMRGGQ